MITLLPCSEGQCTSLGMDVHVLHPFIGGMMRMTINPSSRDMPILLDMDLDMGDDDNNNNRFDHKVVAIIGIMRTTMANRGIHLVEEIVRRWQIIVTYLERSSHPSLLINVWSCDLTHSLV